jgi:predicted membrane channel-forming protein YqfA (hemolysin III family)
MKDHLVHYTPLVGILAATILGFCMVTYDKGFRGAIIVAAAVSYVFWGITHHWLHRDLHIVVILEYIAIALLGVTVGLSIIFRV